MICFPNAKINLGLNIIEKRSDGFHNIESVFYPVLWCDALECVENKIFKKGENKILLSLSGVNVGGNLQSNLVSKAYKLLNEKMDLPPVKAHLHKSIPMGAGLGGGSADASFFIKLLNEKFDLKISVEEQIRLAKQLGSDCAFFIDNKPVLATGRGDEFRSVKIDLANYQIVIVYPDVHSNTAEAYKGVVPVKPGKSISKIIAGPVKDWKNNLVNDFEKNIFARFPELQKIKEKFYHAGALYASMSGSGSAMYAIFEENADIQQFKFPADYLTWNSAI